MFDSFRENCTPEMKSERKLTESEGYEISYQESLEHLQEKDSFYDEEEQSSQNRRFYCCFPSQESFSSRTCNVYFPIVTIGILALIGINLWMYGPWDKSAATISGAQRYQFMQCDKKSDDIYCCNGLESNCALKVNEIMFATVHNAHSSKSDDFFGANNIYPIEEALKAGYRAFFLDSCTCRGGKVQFCHSFCEAGTRDPRYIFEIFTKFLSENPSEVILLEIEINNESFYPMYEVMSQTPGFLENLYVHPSVKAEWPTMRNLVQNNTRLIISQHNGPNCWDEDCPTGILATFENMFDTPFELTAHQLLDYSLSCEIKRGQWGHKSFFILNHYATNIVGLSDTYDARMLNRFSSLESHVEACAKVHRRPVSLLVVNFWEIGDVTYFVQAYNQKLSDVKKLQEEDASNNIKPLSELHGYSTFTPTPPVDQKYAKEKNIFILNSTLTMQAGNPIINDFMSNINDLTNSNFSADASMKSIESLREVSYYQLEVSSTSAPTEKGSVLNNSVQAISKKISFNEALKKESESSTLDFTKKNLIQQNKNTKSTGSPSTDLYIGTEQVFASLTERGASP